MPDLPKPLKTLTKMKVSAREARRLFQFRDAGCHESIEIPYENEGFGARSAPFFGVRVPFSLQKSSESLGK
jgi:hypothetical protein